MIPQQALGLSVADMSLDDNIIVHLTHVVGVCCLMGWESPGLQKKERTKEKKKKVLYVFLYVSCVSIFKKLIFNAYGCWCVSFLSF